MSWRELRIATATEEHFSHQIWRLATLKTHHLHCSSLFVIMKYRTFVKNNSKKSRENYSKVVGEVLKEWLHKHLTNPYPSDEEKLDLAKKTGLTVLQVNNWFINARRREFKSLIDESKQACEPINGLVDDIGGKEEALEPGEIRRTPKKESYNLTTYPHNTDSLVLSKEENMSEIKIENDLGHNSSQWEYRMSTEAQKAFLASSLPKGQLISV